MKPKKRKPIKNDIREVGWIRPLEIGKPKKPKVYAVQHPIHGTAYVRGPGAEWLCKAGHDALVAESVNGK